MIMLPEGWVDLSRRTDRMSLNCIHMSYRSGCFSAGQQTDLLRSTRETTHCKSVQTNEYTALQIIINWVPIYTSL